MKKGFVMKIVDVLVSIFGLISEGWNLIFKLALVIIAIVVVVGVVKSCAANATLNEHSSCQQFAQADTATQNKVLQDMLNARGDKSGIVTARFSVTLYCDVHDPDSPIDGIYNSSSISQQFVSLSSNGNL